MQLDIQAIQALLPHRYPLLLVDRIVEMEENRIVGIKNVTTNEPHFAGHFPDYPGDARGADHRGDGADRGRVRPQPHPRPRKQAGLLRHHREREVSPARWSPATSSASRSPSSSSSRPSPRCAESRCRWRRRGRGRDDVPPHRQEPGRAGIRQCRFIRRPSLIPRRASRPRPTSDPSPSSARTSRSANARASWRACTWKGPLAIGDDNLFFPYTTCGVASQDMKYQGERSETRIGHRNRIREFVTIHRGTQGGGMVTTHRLGQPDHGLQPCRSRLPAGRSLHPRQRRHACRPRDRRRLGGDRGVLRRAPVLPPRPPLLHRPPQHRRRRTSCPSR